MAQILIISNSNQIMKTRTKFYEDRSENEKSHVNGKKASNLKQILRQCKSLITELQQSNLMLERELTQKKLIIDKLIEEKQQHILHMSSCTTNIFRIDLEKAIAQMQDKQAQYIKSIDQYQAITKRDREEIYKLKGYNKVLRIENNRLREQATEGKMGANRRAKIGSISNGKKEAEYLGIPTFGSSHKSHLLDQINFNNLDTVTPLKSFKSTMSTAFTHSNNLGPVNWNKSTELSSQNYAKLSPSLNQHQPLRNTFYNEEANIEQLKPFPNEIKQKFGKVQTWIKRLKDILADTSEDEQEISQ